MTGYRSNAKAICVLGMHRGGTSAVTGVLHELGAFLGPAGHLMAKREDNPAGFFEHQLLTDLNDELLHALGGSWHHPPAFDTGWEHSPGLEGIRERARQLLHEDFADAPLWAWKDPRTCLTLPFWRPLLPPMQFVVCVRNPLDVARSLLARDGLDEAVGVDLWLRHTVGALTGHATMPLLVLYDDIVTDPAREVARIAAFLALDVVPSAMARAQAHLADNAGLRHHHTTFAEVCAEPAASFAAVALYAVLQRLASLQRAGALRLDDLHDAAGPLAVRAARAHNGERDAADRSARLAALDVHVAGLAGALEARAADLVRAREDVAALTSRLNEAWSDGARLDALLLERETEAAARLSARDAEAAALLLALETEAAARLSASHAEAAALRAAHDADLAALRTRHDIEVAALRTDHDTSVAALRAEHAVEVTTLRAVRGVEAAASRAAHDAAVTALRSAHDAEVAALRSGHDAEVGALRSARAVAVAERQAQAAADAAVKAGLHGDVQSAHAELSAAGAEVDRLNALLLHLQTPKGIVKLGLRALLPPGVHGRLRSWAEWARGGPSSHDEV